MRASSLVICRVLPQLRPTDLLSRWLHRVSVSAVDLSTATVQNRVVTSLAIESRQQPARLSLASPYTLPSPCTSYYSYIYTDYREAHQQQQQVHLYVLKLGSSSSLHMEMMNNDPDDAAAGGGPWWWCCDNDNTGEATAAAAVPTTGESGSFFANVMADYSTYT